VAQITASIVARACNQVFRGSKQNIRRSDNAKMAALGGEYDGVDAGAPFGFGKSRRMSRKVVTSSQKRDVDFGRFKAG
jgi:hypothetical protein